MRTRICPKCGGQMSGPKFVNNMYYEYLEFTCLCGYIKSEPTLDNQEGDGEEHAK